MHKTKTNPNITVVFEDNHLLVIDKPAGVLSQEDHTGDPDVLTLCKQYLKKKYNKPGNVFLGLVHRLDKPVSGLMVLARTSKAASRLSEQIRKQNIDKTYWALVEGMTPLDGQLTHYLAKDNRTNFVKAYASKRGSAKKAELSYTTIKQSRNHSLVEVDLITGRPHQIRVQFAKEGFPLFGDNKYGETGDNNDLNIGLRSMKLSFKHPTTKKSMYFKVKPPKEQPWTFFHY